MSGEFWAGVGGILKNKMISSFPFYPWFSEPYSAIIYSAGWIGLCTICCPSLICSNYFQQQELKFSELCPKSISCFCFLLSWILELQTLMRLCVWHARLRPPDNVPESTWALLQTAHGYCVTQTATPPRHEQQWSVRGLVGALGIKHCMFKTLLGTWVNQWLSPLPPHAFSSPELFL